jgi:hypothetical protein
VNNVRDHRTFLNDMVLACRSNIHLAEVMTPDDYLAYEKNCQAVMRTATALDGAGNGPGTLVARRCACRASDRSRETG